MNKKYPFVKQNDLKDCAAASLLMIIRYYKGNISKEKISEMTKTSKSGTTAYNLIEAAKEIGFHSSGIKIDLNSIKTKKIILPCIAHVVINNVYQHYIVIYKINYNKKTLLIADPADRLKKITFEQFEQIYDNILIILYPKKKIPVYDKEKSFFKYLKKQIFNNKKLIVVIIILSLFITIFSILNSFYFQISLRYMNKEKIFNKLVLIFIIFEILKNSYILFRNQLLIIVREKITKELWMDTLKKIIFLPYYYYRNRTSGEMVTRINDLGIIRNTISEVFLTLFIDVILTIISAIVLLSLNKLLFLFSITFLLIYIVIFLFFKPLLYNYLNKVKNSYSNMNSNIVEVLTGFETVKGLGIENNIITKLNHKLESFLQKEKQLELASNLEQSLIGFVNGFVSIIMIYIGFILIRYNKMNISSLVTFLFLSNYFLEPVKNVLNVLKNIEESKISYQRISEINDYVSNNKINNVKFQKIKIKEHPTLYNESKFLKNNSLTISLKEKIALVGPSGSGKSTLLKVMKNYYPINQVLANNKKLDSYNLEDINKNIVYISQNEILFTDTLYNNIVLNEEVKQEKFYQVMKDCYIDDIIKKNPLKYYMLIEENGFNISGGEKQRIILARALLRDFNYLLIDEGLSQVDVSLERKILKNLLKHYSDKTVIFVTHRMDNIDLFERVIRMENGNILDDLKRNGKEVV